MPREVNDYYKYIIILVCEHVNVSYVCVAVRSHNFFNGI